MFVFIKGGAVEKGRFMKGGCSGNRVVVMYMMLSTSFTTEYYPHPLHPIPLNPPAMNTHRSNLGVSSKHLQQTKVFGRSFEHIAQV